MGSGEEQTTINATAPNASGRPLGSQTADNWGNAGKGPLGVLGLSSWDGVKAPAKAVLSEPMLSGPIAPNLSNEDMAFGDQSGNAVGEPWLDIYPPRDTRSPVLRELEKYRKGAAMPAVQPNTVYSPAGDFFGNFSRGSADAATRSPVSFKTSGPNAGDQATDNFSNGPTGVLGGFIGNSPMDPAEARPSMRGLGAADFSSEGASHIDPSENAPRGSSPAAYPQLRRGSSAFPNVMPRDPEQLGTTPEPAPLLGIFSGEPILPLPHAVWGLPDRSSASPRGALSDLLAGLSRRNPAELPPDDDPHGFHRDERGRPWFLQSQRY
jgi:hypothetical protein